MSFVQQLAKGQKYELEAKKYFDVAECKQSQGYFPDYDLDIRDSNGERTLVEVKADFMAHRTGNFAIEWQCNKKPSGLSSTKADVWTLFCVRDGKHDCYIIPVEELRELVKSCRSVAGGNGFRARMYLLPVAKLNGYLKFPLP